jgi:ribosome-binding protein aMBF1 (putative translation factor)
MTNQDSNRDGLKIHPFEARGLGKAPFRFAGQIHQDLCYGEAILNRAEYEKTGIALTTQPGGTCDYCGTAIKKMYQIVSSDGKTFKVGCDCVMKTGDHKLKKAISAVVRAEQKKTREAKKVAVKAEYAALLADPDTKQKLAGKTVQTFTQTRDMFSYYEFMFKACGAAGMSRYLKALKAELSK